MPKLRSFSGPLHEQSYRFAVAIVLLSRKLMEEQREFVLSKQLLRSGTSIGANIEEAQQAQSKADFISKMSIALKECAESRYWLRLLCDTGAIDVITTNAHIDHCEELLSMLASSIKTLRSK